VPIHPSLTAGHIDQCSTANDGSVTNWPHSGRQYLTRSTVMDRGDTRDTCSIITDQLNSTLCVHQTAYSISISWWLREMFRHIPAAIAMHLANQGFRDFGVSRRTFLSDQWTENPIYDSYINETRTSFSFHRIFLLFFCFNSLLIHDDFCFRRQPESFTHCASELQSLSRVINSLLTCALILFRRYINLLLTYFLTYLFIYFKLLVYFRKFHHISSHHHFHDGLK